MNRAEYIPIGDSYTLFDSKGKRVHVLSHLRISKTLTADVSVTSSKGKSYTLKKGKTVEGGVSAWGVYFDAWDHENQKMLFDSDWDAIEKFSNKVFTDGATLMMEKNDGSDPEEGTLQIAYGQMHGEVSKTVPLSNLKGMKLYAREYGTCASNTLNAGGGFHGTVQLEVAANGNNGYKLVKTAKASDYTAECDFEYGWVQCSEWDNSHVNCTDSILTPTFDAVSKEDVVIPDGTGQSGWGLDVFSTSFEGSGRIYPADENPKQNVIISEGGILSPSKDGTIKTLKCRGRCVDGSQISLGGDIYVYTNDKRNSFRTYKYNEKTGMLYDENDIKIFKENDDIHMTLYEDNAKTWTELGCDASVTTSCKYKEPSVKYYWSTGTWSKTVSLKTSTGAILSPAKPIKLDLQFPSDLQLRTLSGVNYAGKTIGFTYESGWIDGLPLACFERSSFSFSESKTKYQPWGFEFSCPMGTERVPDLRLPDGVPVTNTAFSGKKTKYVLKAKGIRQMLKSQASSNCASLQGAPATAVIPTKEDVGTLVMATKPDAEGLKIKVEAGEVNAEYLPASDSE